MLPLTHSRRRTIRAPVNPMDKATIVSIFPKDVKQINPTIQPGYFHIPAGSYENPSIIVVGPSSWWREIDEEQPLLEIPNSAIQVADSIVKDYCNGLLGYSNGVAQPGMFYVPGEYNLKGIKENFMGLLIKAKSQQDEYWKSLVRLADALWARTNGNPLCIADDMRTAAKELNLQNKDWMADFSAMSMVSCPACGTMVRPGFPVCPNCKNIVDKTRAEELGIHSPELVKK